MSLIIVFPHNCVTSSPASSHTHASSSMHATSPPTSSSCTLRNTSQSAPQLLHRCPLNVLPHHCVGRNELASVQADWALFSRACSLLVACGLVRLRILARSHIHMHRVYKHVLSREETQAHGYSTRTWRSASASRSSVAGLQAAVAIGRGRRHAPTPQQAQETAAAAAGWALSQLAMASRAPASAGPWPGRTQAGRAAGLLGGQ